MEWRCTTVWDGSFLLEMQLQVMLDVGTSAETMCQVFNMIHPFPTCSFHTGPEVASTLELLLEVLLKINPATQVGRSLDASPAALLTHGDLWVRMRVKDVGLAFPTTRPRTLTKDNQGESK